MIFQQKKNKSTISNFAFCFSSTSPMVSRKSRTENVISNDENETSIDQISGKDVFDDDTSKLSFKEKMTLFNQKKSMTSSASAKANRNRLTQVKRKRKKENHSDHHDSSI